MTLGRNEVWDYILRHGSIRTLRNFIEERSNE